MKREYYDLEEAIEAVRAVERLGLNFSLEKKTIENISPYFTVGRNKKTVYYLVFKEEGE